MGEATDRSGNSHEGSKRNDATESADQNSAFQIESGVSISSFDDSVDNFFAAMGSISALCGETGVESFEGGELERFSSMITFLKEWKHFCYEPKIIRFAYDIGSEQVKDATDGISLSQFSSANVPKIEQLPNETRCLDGNDFVLHAGGPVWALDWCPRIHEKPDCNIKCEYLAVAAHPPGSTYHKIGIPLIGRGVIQIWCLLNLDEKVEFPPPRSTVKGRPRKIAVKEEPAFDSKGKEVSTIPRHFGRPKKRPIMSADDPNGLKELSPVKPRGRPRKRPILVLNDEKESSLKRPRGRPRKRPLPDVNDSNGNMESPSFSNNLILSMIECIPPLNVDLGAVALAMPVSADLDDRVESFVPRRRGRPRKKPIPSVNECCVPASGVKHGKDSSALPTSRGLGALRKNVVTLPVSADLNGKAESFVSRRRGRPSKKPIPSVNECVPVIEFGESSSAPLTPRGLGMLSENIVASPVSAYLNGKVESFVPMLRGGPRKKPIPSISKCFPAPNVELRKDSSLHTSRGLDALSENGVALPVSANLNGKLESFVPRRRGRPRKTPIAHLDECVPASGVEFREDSFVVPVSIELGTLSEDGVAGSSQTNRAFAIESCEDFNNRMIETKSGSSTCIKRQIMKDKVKEVANDRTIDQTIHTINKNELSVTVVSENSENAVAVTCQTDDGVTMEFGPTTCIQRGREKDKARAFSCLNYTNPSLSAIGEHKESAVTEEGIVQSKEVDQKRALIPKDTALPRVVLCLAHNGKVAWDVKWRPSIVNNSEGKHHLGYLAVLLGNGSLEVWEVPLPSMVKFLYTSCHTEGTDPRFLKLEPIFRCSKVKCGDRQSIPLTVEWSPSAPCDLILAGCHDGTVALWKFSTQHSSQDTKPLLCYTADSVPIRALAWAPEESDAESANLIVTAGHEGLKFWDIRDPYHPLWDFNPVQKVILSLDWLKDPRCLILSLDDGTLRIFSLWKAACDVPITGEPFSGTKQLGLHSYPCSPFAIWSVQVSRSTGLVAYCTADGSARRFQLTAKAVEKDSRRYRMPHFLCGSLVEEGQVIKINTPLPDVPLQNIPLHMKKPPNELGDAPRTLCGYLSDRNKSRLANSLDPALCSGDGHTRPVTKTTSKPGKSEKADPCQPSEQAFTIGETEEETLKSTEKKQDGSKQGIIEFPPKIVAMHKVRWNMNKGSERWLCYGGAAGIIRCQQISLTAMQ